jgi:hypothetical protein
MADFITLDITGDKQLVDELDQLYPAMANDGVQTANKYLVDMLNEYSRGAPYNYLSWAVGGPGPYGGFFSERQRRYVMAGISSGEIRIPYQRLSGDPYHTVGEGSEQIIESTEQSMIYSMSDESQSKMQAIRGWEKISLFLHDREADIRDAFERGVKEAIEIMGRMGLK